MDRNEIYQKKYAFAWIEKQEVLYGRKKESDKNEAAEDVRVNALQVYIKPEENAAYYVINQKKSGKIDLF